MFIVINKMRSTVQWLTECCFKHAQVYFQFSGCGLDQKVVWHCTQHTASESGTAFAGPAGPSMPPLQYGQRTISIPQNNSFYKLYTW